MARSTVKHIFVTIIIIAAVIWSILLVLSRGEYGVAAEVDPGNWGNAETVELTHHNTDTLSLRNIWLFVRTDCSFADRYGELRLNISTITPDSRSYSEDWIIYPDRDKPRSTFVQDYYEYRRLYRGNVKLSKEGDYTFSIQHTNPKRLEGVWAVGIEIE